MALQMPEIEATVHEISDFFTDWSAAAVRAT